MARARELDASLLLPLYHKWKAVGERSAKGEIVGEACALWGITKPVIYKAFQRLDRGYSGFDVARGQVPRTKNAATRGIEERRYAYAKIIASYKYASKLGQKGYVIPTANAIEIALADGRIRAEDILSRSQTDRLMKSLGISNRDFSVDKKTAVEVIAYYANEVWVVDATPLNRHFLTIDGGIKYRNDLDPEDKHLPDILQRDGLAKIWVFYAVDLFSRVYFCHAFAPAPTTPGAKFGGENAFTWMQFLDMAFLPKENYAFEGLPEIIYSDRFSGIKSPNGPMRNFFSALNIRSETHLPKNSRAKGSVEGRQSAFKRRFETILNLFASTRRELNLDSLNRYFMAVSRKQNHEDGKFALYLESTKTHPLRRVTIKNLQDARVRFIPRKLTIHKCVTVKWNSTSPTETYFVEGAGDFERGHEFHMFRNVDGKVMAQDPKTGRIFACDARGKLKRHFGDWDILDERHGLSDTEAERLRKEIAADAPAVRRAINFDAVFPAVTNILSMRPPGEAIETTSVVAPDFFESGDEVRAWLALTSHMSFAAIGDDLRARIDKIIALDLELNGSVSQQTAMRLLDSLVEVREQNHKEII